jgi:hypothetical protein
MLRRRALCVAAVTLACGGHDSNAGSGGAGAVAATVGATSSTGPSAPVFFASIVAEKQPGEAPAFLSLKNSTDVYLSLWLGGATYIALPAGETGEPQLSWTADVAAEIKIGYCLPDGGSCVTFKPNIKSGPNLFAPGKYYGIAASGTKGGVDLDIAESSGEPFVALRALDKPHLAGGNMVKIEFENAAPIELETPYASPTGYTLVAKGSTSSATLSRITFTVVGSDSKTVSTATPVKLSGASGFTVVIDTSPVSGAVASTLLK